MQGAYLRDADLRCADLRAADLSGADVTGAKWRYANVEELTPIPLRREALSQGALAVPKDEWKMPPECRSLIAGRLTTVAPDGGRYFDN
jgi:hypothetical protein